VTSARDRIEEIVRGSDIVLFMKGTELFPQCGFSSRAVAILEHLQVPFKTVDVLQDPVIRQGVK
jgi:monothiol glutaredoxin